MIEEEAPKGVKIPARLSTTFITRWKKRFNLATRKMEGETGQYAFTDADYEAARVKVASDLRINAGFGPSSPPKAASGRQ